MDLNRVSQTLHRLGPPFPKAVAIDIRSIRYVERSRLSNKGLKIPHGLLLR